MKVETFKIKGWKEGVTGIVLKENSKWILLNEVPGDYETDGYSILNKKYIKKRSSDKRDKQVALVLKLKQYEPVLPASFKMDHFKSIFKWIENKYGFFQFQDQVEDSIEIGIVEEIKKNKLFLLFLKPNGKFRIKYAHEYKLSEIRKITFDTHYLNSLKLLFEYKNS